MPWFLRTYRDLMRFPSPNPNRKPPSLQLTSRCKAGEHRWHPTDEGTVWLGHRSGHFEYRAGRGATLCSETRPMTELFCNVPLARSGRILASHTQPSRLGRCKKIKPEFIL